MTILRLCFAIGAALWLSACGANRAAIDTTALTSIDALDHELDPTDSLGPTVDQYQSVRTDFLANMAIMQQRYEGGRSTAGTIKRIVAMTGVVVGWAGTIASFIVDEDDTKATVSQSAGGVAAVSGLVALLPFGSQPKGTGSVDRYLALEIPRFERRWPGDMAGPLTAEEWDRFKRDARHMNRVAGELAR